jgi:hypothetical protein
MMMLLKNRLPVDFSASHGGHFRKSKAENGAYQWTFPQALSGEKSTIFYTLGGMYDDR